MKTACIYHKIDLDGWMSAAIVRHWWKLKHIQGFNDKGIEKCFYPLEESLEFIGYNYGQPIPDLSEYDEVIMCDISFSRETMVELLNKFDNKLIWIDHHISAIKDVVGIHKALQENGTDISTAFNGLRDTNFAACELTWLYFFAPKGKATELNDTPEIVRLLGMYDSFRHKGTDEEQKVLEFQYAARAYITNYEEAYEELLTEIRLGGINSEIVNNGKGIYKHLCTEAKQAYKNGFVINLYEPNCKIAIDGVLKFICTNKERFNPINFGIDYHKEGYDGAACFWFMDNKWNFSLYNDNGLVDCSAIAGQFIFNGKKGGGHKGAAGFLCDSETLLKIIGNK